MTTRRVFGTSSAGSTSAIVYGRNTVATPGATAGTGTVYTTNIVNWLHRDGLVTFTANVTYNNTGGDMTGGLTMAFPGMPLPIVETIVPVAYKSAVGQIATAGGGATVLGYMVNNNSQAVLNISYTDHGIVNANHPLGLETVAGGMLSGTVQVSGHYFTNN